jgi:hypothetical protein
MSSLGWGRSAGALPERTFVQVADLPIPACPLALGAEPYAEDPLVAEGIVKRRAAVAGAFSDARLVRPGDAVGGMPEVVDPSVVGVDELVSLGWVLRGLVDPDDR